MKVGRRKRKERRGEEEEREGKQVHFFFINLFGLKLAREIRTFFLLFLFSF